MECNVTYDHQTALIVVDVQNDFADVAGSLYVKGGEHIVPLINAEVVNAKAAGGFVVYTRDWHPDNTPHFAKDGGVWPVHCVMNTWGAKFHPDLLVDGPEVKKGSNGEDGYSGFSMRDPETDEVIATGLESMLRERGIIRLVIAGLATDYCVKATALDGLARQFEAQLLTRAIRPVDLNPGDGLRAIDEVIAAGGSAR
ncbi:MAG: isochorismatase family protein [Acidimicrobiia bacterium]|nr:isochorismatase family protein [Acidimicrobiia bacterium]MDH3397313.1 isochorismatase family protein [Acidimicrobiia bacterium]